VNSAAESTDDNRCRVGIIGTGVGSRYGRLFASRADTEVVAVCSGSRATARPLADELELDGVFTSVAEMLETIPLDLVVIATPNHLHFDMASLVIEHGVDVICEKPLALDAEQASELWRRAEQRGVRHLVPFWWCFVPAFSEAARVIESGLIGEPSFVTVAYLNRGWGNPRGPMRWQFERKRAGSGALANIGSHALAVMGRLLTSDLQAVSAMSAISVSERLWPDGSVCRPDVEDTMGFVGALENGATVSFVSSSVAHVPGSSLRIEIHGERGSVSAAAAVHDPDATEDTLEVTDARGRRVRRSWPIATSCGETPGTATIEAAFGALIDEFLEAIREHRPANPGFDVGVGVQQIMDAVLQSARSARVVPVNRENPSITTSATVAKDR
jgi:predicted dehydrogenase